MLFIMGVYTARFLKEQSRALAPLLVAHGRADTDHFVQDRGAEALVRLPLAQAGLCVCFKSLAALDPRAWRPRCSRAC